MLLHVSHAVTLSFQLPFLVKGADTQYMLHVMNSDCTPQYGSDEAHPYKLSSQ
jgi:hypothetical protein